jgi:hypothetical protein
MDTEAPTKPKEDMNSQQGTDSQQNRKPTMALHTDVNYEVHRTERDTSVRDKAINRDITKTEQDAARAASETVETEDNNEGTPRFKTENTTA